MTSFINLISEKHKFRASRAFKLRKRGGERKLIRRNKTDRQEKKQVSKFNKLKEQIETSAKVSKVISCASPLEFRTELKNVSSCAQICLDTLVSIWAFSIKFFQKQMISAAIHIHSVQLPYSHVC